MLDRHDERPPVPPPELVAAWLTLHDLDPAAVPTWAAWWMVDGNDGPAVTALAVLDGRDANDVRDALPAALREMGVETPSLEEALRTAYTDKAHQALHGGVDELELARWVERIYVWSDYSDAVLGEPLGDIYGIDDELGGGWGRSEAALRQAVRTACEAQVSQSEPH